MPITCSTDLSHVLSLIRRKPPAWQAVLATRKSQDRIAELHNHAAFAHAAAAAAFCQGDISSAAELSKQAYTHSVNASAAMRPDAAPSRES